MGVGETKSSKTKLPKPKRGSKSNTQNGYAKLQSFGPVWGHRNSPIERNVWALGTTARPGCWCITSSCLLTEEKKSPVRHISPGSALSGPSVPSASENGPGSQESRGIPETRVWRRWSVVVPCHAGAVRVVDRQRVGFRVEHPVLRRQHVIFREQKIEVSVWQGRW